MRLISTRWCRPIIWCARSTVLLDLSWVHKELAPYYSHTGRPSIDPVLMIRMLIVGYVFALRSERRLCAEVQVNLAYRWFCKLGIEDKIPDHSVFCRARHERFRESDALRRVFEGVVAMCIAAGLVGGEAFSIDASLIKADVDKKKRVPGDQPIAWPKAEEASHAVREYLAALDAARSDEEMVTVETAAVRARRRQSTQASQGSLADRSAGDMGRQAGRGPILCLRCELSDRQQGRDHPRCRWHARQSHRGDCRHPDHDGSGQRRFDLRPQRLAGDTAYGAVRLLKWLVDRNITPHVPVWDKSARPDGTFSRADFVFDQERNVYICPGGAELTSTGNIDQGHIVYYRASKRRLLALFIEAEVHDGGRAQDHPRPQRGCARSRPRAGQHRSLPAVTPRAQEGRDAVCAYEAHPQARPASAARPERRQGRSAADRHRAEPEATRQAPLPCPTTCGSRLLSIHKQNGNRRHHCPKNHQSSKAKLGTRQKRVLQHYPPISRHRYRAPASHRCSGGVEAHCGTVMSSSTWPSGSRK